MTDFERDGWLVVPRAFRSENIRRLQWAFDNVIQGNYATGIRPYAVENFGGKLVKVSGPRIANFDLYWAILHPALGKLAAGLLGVESIYLWSDSLYYKAAGADGEQAKVGWHQDKKYWPFSSSDKMITAVIQLHEVGRHGGGLGFVDGSHRWGLCEGSDFIAGADNAGEHTQPKIPEGANWEETYPEFEAGDVSFHHCMTFHGSGPNLTDQPRRTISVHMVDGAAVLQGWSPEHGNVDVFGPIGNGNPFRGTYFPKIWPNE